MPPILAQQAFLVAPWVAALGRRPFMLLGVALVVLSSVLACVASGVTALGLVRALQGLGFSAFFVENYSYVLDLVPSERRGWALGIYGPSGMACTAIAPPVRRDARCCWSAPS